MDSGTLNAPGPSRAWAAMWRASARPWLVLLFVLFAVQVTWWWVPGRDACAYLSIARSLSEGAPARLGSSHLYYAPGYSLLASPLYLTGDRPFLLLSLLNLALVLALALGIMRWMQRLVGDAGPVLATLTLVNVSLWSLYRATLSEVAFMTAVVWGAVLLRGPPERRGQRLAGSLLVAAAVLTRQAGLALLGGMALVLWPALRDRSLSPLTATARWLGAALPAVLVFLAMQWHDHANASDVGREGERYLRQALASDQGLLAQFLEGSRLRMAEVGRLLLPGMHKAYAPAGQWWHINTLVYGAVSAAVGWGWWRLARTQRDILLWGAPFYVLLYVIWPFDQGTRFLTPLLPVLVVSLWSLLGTGPARRYRRVIIVALLVAHLGVATGAWVRDLRLARYDDRWAAIDQIVETVRQDRGAVAAPGLDRREALMLQLALDRPLLAPRTDARWRVLAADETIPTDFALHARVGPWRLVRRQPPR